MKRCNISLLPCLRKQDVYWIDFVSDFGFYRRQTSQQGTLLVPGLVAPNHLVPGNLDPFFVRVFSYHFFGSPRPIFYNRVEIINAILLCVKIYFLNLLLYKKWIFDQMHIGKFYHISCNTVLCRLFNSVNPLCLFVSMYIHE